MTEKIQEKTVSCAEKKAIFRAKIFYASCNIKTCGGVSNKYCLLKFDVTNLLNNCSMCSDEKKNVGETISLYGYKPKRNKKM